MRDDPFHLPLLYIDLHVQGQLMESNVVYISQQGKKIAQLSEIVNDYLFSDTLLVIVLFLL